MIKLDLKAESPELEALKTYLEENASEILASKINKGVRIEKDGITLINKKTLETFMNYAHDEAKKLAAKGAKFACIKSDIVFNWAIHYFEEDSIEGTLYNEDGTPYKVAPKTPQKINKPVPATVISKPSKPESKQFTLFDLMGSTTKNVPVQAPEPTAKELENSSSADDMEVDEETGEIFNPKTVYPSQPSSLYQKYLGFKKKYPEHVVAYRLGDFYEVFGDDAIKLSNHLLLTLTGRDCGVDGRVAMIGFPYHAADNYFFKITEKYPLVIVDRDNVSIMPVIQDNDDNEEYDDELTEDEMREFDGDINESFEPNMKSLTEDEDDELDIEYMKYIDKEAFMILVELLDDKLDVQ